MESLNKADLPEEVLLQIIEELGGSLPTLTALSAVSKQFCRISRPSMFSQVTIEDKDRLSRFLDLYSKTGCRLPIPVGRGRLVVKDPSILDTIPPAELKMVRANVQARDSLVIHLPHGQIPSTLLQLLGAWSGRICQLTLSGGHYAPSAFFTLLSSFSQLRSLVLVEFTFEPAEGSPGIFSLPQTVDQLAFVRCPGLPSFFDAHAMPRGWSSIRELYIQAAFSMDQAGIPDLMEIIRVKLQAVERLTLDALYDERDNHIDPDMTSIFCPEAYMHMASLKRLCFNLAKVPSQVAMNVLKCCSVPNPRHSIKVIDIHFPTSPDLWPGTSPSDELGHILQGLEVLDGLVRRRSRGHRAKLVVHGFSRHLPERFQAQDDSMVWGLNQFPLAFGCGDGEQIMKKTLGIT